MTPKSVIKYTIFRTFVLYPGNYILHEVIRMTDLLKQQITEQLQICSDADLLDFILKLLVAEGGNEQLNAGILPCG